MTLGVGRNEEIIANVYDENHEQMNRSIALVIGTAEILGPKIGICN
ncbi:putative PEP-binding protein [Roseimaritima multifibrata]|nr:putative PEP-binding protein [Roseimaritima multifibrata]